MILQEWATKHGVSQQALLDLRQMMTRSVICSDTLHDSTTETDVQARVRLAASRKGILLWRNNVGAGTLDNGSYVRWGLCNDSKALNDKAKSSDLIGIEPVTIGTEHVGTTIGRFVSLEVKRSDWKYSGTKREIAQKHWLEVILAAGGRARFITDEKDI
jgi:hypothetical protein